MAPSRTDPDFRPRNGGARLWVAIVSVGVAALALMWTFSGAASCADLQTKTLAKEQHAEMKTQRDKVDDQFRQDLIRMEAKTQEKFDRILLRLPKGRNR